MPTLVVFGTADAMIPPEMGRIYREKMPNCNYVLVYDAGHEVGAERPEAFVSLVSDFLERREAFIVTREELAAEPVNRNGSARGLRRRRRADPEGVLRRRPQARRVARHRGQRWPSASTSAASRFATR